MKFIYIVPYDILLGLISSKREEIYLNRKMKYCTFKAKPGTMHTENAI